LSCVLAGKESATVLESGSLVVPGRGSGSGSVAVPWRGNESGCGSRSRSLPGRVTVSGSEPGTGTPAERPEHHQGPLMIVPR